ncbi:phosphoribosylformylglycinamidine synthase [Methanobrevibacter arboriphilus]|jgi:phosphoribosylformylglycinamidine synthase|uniref:phosphoribosylformylglycinamidine synthase subunit PurL n=1 Tax=Methanobrevibacter arboriphilus TaxID=39441 RepID=UPI0022EFCEE7|nr:phosphoribosylformylglycinamidine synthase subunit PurL [Methanobrevibacter arboriphilus]MCC7561784.1 phosphoribosylformylglycinamidine synthase subunit PurL [Methanobrevibacter arboriphilus]GLI11742.1 phosphoribosylformylglycinamidine synthase [Methanobrevibacter arboriphilus]
MTLTDSEMDYIEQMLGRSPNELEEGMLDIMFSEHCSYKSSRPILGLFPTEGKNIILGPGDDAGMVAITDKLALAVGIESHNHPSAIEPYGGAGTGIGGILRDIISMGAMPIALLDSLRFGPLEDQKSRYLFEHVVKGISDYGNRVGVPTVGGEVEFDESFRTNPLVNVMCAGIVEKDNIVKGIAPNVGDVFLLMGGLTGRDGIHGVTFASEELTSDSEIEDRPAVQVGDPFTKKKVLEASLEILENIDVAGVKDLGGGGLTCCISELVDKCGNGALVDLNSIPLREEGMTPYEVMLSESQERMVFVINPKYVDEAFAICDKYELPRAIIGEVTDTKLMVVEDPTKKDVNGDNKIIASMPTVLLADPPSLNREIRAPKKDDNYVAVENSPIDQSILKILSSPNIATKKWVYKQYDHEVQVRTVVKPGDDAAVLKIDDENAVVLSCDCNSIHTKLSPYDGGAGSVAEAIRNVVSMGAEPYAVVDCLNFGNPENPEILWQFKQCVKGMADLAEKFETPVISGNVSFYNETEGIKINPSPTVGVIGVTDLNNIRTMEFKNEGDKILIIGATYDEIDGSEYHRAVHDLEQGEAPKIRIDNEIKSSKSILKLLANDNGEFNSVENISNNTVTAIHDCSAGGIAIALSEMAISSGIGAEIDLSNIPIENSEDIDDNNLLFSESHGRYIVTVKSDELENVLDYIDVPCACIGEVKGNSLKIRGNDNNINISVNDLKDAYNGVIEQFMA